MKRKKRLEKGIGSLEEQREIHEEKKRKAHEEGKIELENYYDRELGKIDREIEKKEEKRDRK